MLSLSDTTFRIYQKKNGGQSLRLKSYLLIDTNASFSFPHYCRSISAKLTLQNGTEIPLSIGFSQSVSIPYQADTMVHDFWLSGEVKDIRLKSTVARLRVDYHISFTGHSSEEPSSFEIHVPLIVNTSLYKGQ
ncbi:MAG: hypothetical protein ACI9DO_001362 [Reinekea sp.]|nr:hypothetical protein [Pseudomonadota bacterium]